MPTTKAHKTRHHSNLRPKHRQNKKYLEAYWPYLPLMVIWFFIVALLQPWHSELVGGKVLPYATNMSAAALLDSTNDAREDNGQKELKLDKQLTNAAQNKAQDMVAKNYWSHNTPSGEAPWVFIADSGYEYERAGENLAYGFLTSDQVIAGWMNSATHRANILDASFKEVGFGFADNANFDNNGPSTVVVAMYGSPLDSALTSVEKTSQTVLNSSQNNVNSTIASAAPKSTYISKIQLATKGLAPWANYATAVLTGAALMYLIVKHGISLKRLVHRGERFIVQHPILDATILSIGILGIVISQKIGVIL